MQQPRMEILQITRQDAAFTQNNALLDTTAVAMLSSALQRMQGTLLLLATLPFIIIVNFFSSVWKTFLAERNYKRGLVALCRLPDKSPHLQTGRGAGKHRANEDGANEGDAPEISVLGRGLLAASPHSFPEP